MRKIISFVICGLMLLGCCTPVWASKTISKNFKMSATLPEAISVSQEALAKNGIVREIVIPRSALNLTITVIVIKKAIQETKTGDAISL